MNAVRAAVCGGAARRALHQLRHQRRRDGEPDAKALLTDRQAQRERNMISYRLPSLFFRSKQAFHMVPVASVSDFGGCGELLYDDGSALGDGYRLTSAVTQLVGLARTQNLADTVARRVATARKARL